MANIVVIEPHKLLRLGLLKLIGEASHDYHVEGVDYEPLDRGQLANRQYDLALLSIPTFDDAQRLINRFSAYITQPPFYCCRNHRRCQPRHAPCPTR